MKSSVTKITFQIRLNSLENDQLVGKPEYLQNHHIYPVFFLSLATDGMKCKTIALYECLIKYQKFQFPKSSKTEEEEETGWKKVNP